MRTQWLRPRALVHFGLACSVTALTGCGPLDPYQKHYVWAPTGAPQANLAAQLVNPQDLVVGRGSAVTDTNASTLAIQHIWTDTPKSLDGGGGGGSGGSGNSNGNGNGSGAGPGASAGGQGGSSGGTGGSN